MLFNQNLDEIIFNRHQLFESDELIIISGYIGPNPVEKLRNLPLTCTVIYGMYGNSSISPKLHSTLLKLETLSQNTTILYSDIPVHSKCYIWKNKGKIVHALIGSANFSTSGLTIPFRETLAETTQDTFLPLNQYLNQILSNSTPCTEVNLIPNSKTTVNPVTSTNNHTCSMVLYDPRTGEVPTASGLNWCHSSQGHTSIDDGYIPIRTSYIREYPELFPPKQMVATRTNGGKANRQNDSIELIWDDGTIMEALLEGSQPVDGIIHPKNLSSFPSKNILGSYIRHRLGLPSGSLVTKSDLDRYGRDDIELSLLENGTYYADFSIK